MQKTRIQLCLDYHDINFINNFMRENHLINESRAIAELIDRFKRYQVIIDTMTKAAHKAQEEKEIWEKRAKEKLKKKQKDKTSKKKTTKKD